MAERFSEDLDLFVFTGDKTASKQAEKTLNKKLSKFIIEQNNDIYKEDLSETGGNYRKLYFSYNNVFQGVGLILLNVSNFCILYYNRVLISHKYHEYVLPTMR